MGKYDDEEPCKREACIIQDCLNANGYKEAKCAKAIDNLYICCKKFYENNGTRTDQTTTCCPKFSLLEKKLKERGIEPLDPSIVKTRHE
ncbi:cx9C motif-containing protein 4, mitochondrial [[Candida] railenensis]|uniref:Cx9C motif-containing protein 4, mitochondrial n=1 Tax=[Candida] railenensis TaxID=45579 RepID=A0A9P0QMZ1_9ASCO|nr:cx9C motif-containing protein 4, mitochondrial [[Candida] railenensis]